MPHSSGGGSHSGGSHGGGGSSHSSSSRGGGSSGPSIQTSHVYFPGAYRYVRYHDGGMDYVYSNDSTLNQSGRLSLIVLCFYIPFIIAGIWLASQAVNLPRKMHVSYIPAVEVVDNTDCISSPEESLVAQGASDLYKATGVPICVVFDDNSAWKTNYNYLENYAYDLYVNRYEDEDHWLIVYTDDGIDRQDVNSFSDWYFEGMQGDNTDKYLPERLTLKFNEDLNRALTDKSNTTGQAFNMAFQQMKVNAGRVSLNREALPMAIIWNVFVAIHMFFMLFYDPHKKYRNYVSCGRDTEEVARSKEVRCSYCGGVYYKGTVISCPHCGAPLEMDAVQLATSATEWDDSERKKNGFDW